MSNIFKKLMVGLLVTVCFALTACVSTNTRESTGEYIDSAAITTKVKAALVNNLGLASVTGIEVNTFKGVVQLSGFVNNQQDITKAINITKGLSGVVAVENSLLVKSNLK